jgi:glycosyltransferase involved in cell wall biosynthesis
LRLGSSDILYVGGAFWAHPRSVRTYEKAARDGCEVVVLFHDLIPVTFPRLADGGARPLFERMLRLPARAIAVSRYTATQLEQARRIVGAPPHLHPPAVVPLAHEFSDVPRNHSAPHAPSARTAALEPLTAFALCVGTIELRKNHAGLIRLWESLAREEGDRWPKLVVAGRCGWGAEDAFRLLGRADHRCPYRWIEAPTDEELAWLYGRALFTVFPSLAEGWGLPIGESLWFGKPCVASNATSMPEVGGDLCAYADPHQIESFARPIIRLVRDAEYYAASVDAIKARRLRTWAETASEIAASVRGFGAAARLSQSQPTEARHCRPIENYAPG